MPQTVISLPFTRGSGSLTHTQNMGSSADAVLFDQAILSTMWTAPFRMPPNADLSRPMSVWAELQPQTDNTTDGLSAFFRLDSSFWAPNEDPQDADVQLQFPIPNPWLFTNTTRLLFDSGLGFTYEGGLFPPDAVHGIRLRRLAADPIDNYTHPIRCAAALFLAYYLRCQRVCCP